MNYQTNNPNNKFQNYYNSHSTLTNKKILDYRQSKGIDNYHASSNSAIDIIYTDEVNYQVDNLFESDAQWTFPKSSVHPPAYVNPMGASVPLFPVELPQIQHKIDLSKYPSNEDLDYELAEYYDSFQPDISYEQSVDHLNRMVEQNQLYQVKFMSITRYIENKRLAYSLVFKCEHSSAHPMEVRLKESVKDRELCRVFNLYSDWLKSVPSINRVYMFSFKTRLIRLNQQHNYKHMPDEVDHMLCNFHIDPEVDTIMITMTKQIHTYEPRPTPNIKDFATRQVLLKRKNDIVRPYKKKVGPEKDKQREYRQLFNLQDSDILKQVEAEYSDMFYRKTKLINLIYATHYNKFFKLRHMFIYNRPNSTFSILFDDYERSKVRKTIISFTDASTLHDGKLCFLYNKYLFMYEFYVINYEPEYLRLLYKFIPMLNLKYNFDIRLYESSNNEILPIEKKYDSKKIEKIFDQITLGIQNFKINKCMYVRETKIDGRTHWYFCIKFKKSRPTKKLILIDFTPEKVSKHKLKYFYISYIYKLLKYNIICSLHQTLISKVQSMLQEHLGISFTLNLLTSYSPEYAQKKYRDGINTNGKSRTKRFNSNTDMDDLLLKMEEEPTLLKLRYMNLPQEKDERRRPVYFRIQHKNVTSNLGYLNQNSLTRTNQLYILMNYIQIYKNAVTDQMPQDTYLIQIYSKILSIAIANQFDYRFYNMNKDKVVLRPISLAIQNNLKYICNQWKEGTLIDLSMLNKLKTKNIGQLITIIYKGKIKSSVVYSFLAGKFNATNFLFKYIKFLYSKKLINISVFTKYPELMSIMYAYSITGFYHLLLCFRKKDADKQKRNDCRKRGCKGEINLVDLKEGLVESKFKKNKYLSYEKIRNKFAVYFAYYPSRFKKHIFRCLDIESIEESEVQTIYKLYHDFLRYFKICSQEYYAEIKNIIGEDYNYDLYYYNPEQLTVSRAYGTVKVKTEDGEVKVKKERVPREKKVKKEKDVKVKKEKEEGPGVRGIVKFDHCKYNFEQTLNNDLFEKVNLIMRVKNTFYFCIQRAEIKLKIKLLKHQGILNGFRLYKMLLQYIGILGKHNIFKEEELSQLSVMLENFYNDHNFCDIDYTKKEVDNKLYSEFKNKSLKGLDEGSIHQLSLFRKRTLEVEGVMYASYRIKFFHQDLGWISRSLGLIKVVNPQKGQIKLLYLKYYYWLIYYDVLSKRLTKYIKHNLSIHYDMSRIVTSHPVDQAPKASMRGKTYDENIIINLVKESIESNSFRKLRYSYVINMPNFLLVEYSHKEHKRRILKIHEISQMQGNNLAVFLDGYITLAEASKAFSEPTLLKLREMIDEFTQHYDMEPQESEDKKFYESVKQIYSKSLQNNFLEQKMPYTHNYKNSLRFCIVNRNHNFKFKLAKDITSADQITGQRLYEVLHRYLDCLNSISKITTDQYESLKVELEEFRAKYSLQTYTASNEDSQASKSKGMEDEQKLKYDVIELMESALGSKTFIKLRYIIVSHHSIKFHYKSTKSHSKTIFYGKVEELTENVIWKLYNEYYLESKSYNVYPEETLVKMKELLEEYKDNYSHQEEEQTLIKTAKEEKKKNYDELFDSIMNGVNASIETETLQRLNYLYKSPQAGKYTVSISNKDYNFRRQFKLFSNEKGLGLAKILIFYYEFFQSISIFSEGNIVALRDIVHNYYKIYSMYDVQYHKFHQNSILDLRKTKTALRKKKIILPQFARRLKLPNGLILYFFRIYEIEMGFVRHNLYILDDSPTEHQIKEYYNKYFSYVSLYGMETKAHKLLNRFLHVKKIVLEQNTKELADEIISNIQSAVSKNKFVKCKWLNVTNVKGKVCVSFNVHTKTLKDSAKILYVSSIDKVFNDKLCFVYNKYYFLLNKNKLLEQDSLDRINDAIIIMNKQQQFKVLDINLENEKIEVHLDFDMNLGYAEYEVFYSKSKDFYRIYYEIKYSLEIKEFIRCKYMSASKGHLKFTIKNKQFVVNENLGVSEDDLLEANHKDLKDIYSKYYNILKYYEIYPHEYLTMLDQLLNTTIDSTVKNQVKEEI